MLFVEPLIGIEPMTYSLPWSCSTNWATTAGGQDRIRTYEGIEPTDLQSVAFDRFATCPCDFTIKTEPISIDYKGFGQIRQYFKYVRLLDFLVVNYNCRNLSLTSSLFGSSRLAFRSATFAPFLLPSRM